MSKPILIIGRNGQIAMELSRLGSERDIAMEFVGRDRLDVARLDRLESILEDVSPGAVINTAAYTAVDRAEIEPAAAFALNRDLAAAAARLCAARDIPLVHYSTDYVFNGTKSSPYVESDPRQPLCVYGLSKAAGEDAVVAAGGRFIILRTAWVVGGYGQNFLKTMLRLADTRDEIGVVSDQIGRPTWSRSAAQAALVAADLMRADPNLSGLFHAAGADDASWADVAEETFNLSGKAGRPRPRVKRITTAEYGAAAPRPANSRLDSGRFEAFGEWIAMPWHDALASALTEILDGRQPQGRGAQL